MRASRLITAVVALAALGSSGGSASADVTCAYEEAGAAGSRGNILRIRGGEVEDQAAVVRGGQLIRVTDDQTGMPVPCSGMPPTVVNIDRIAFVAAADGAGIFLSLAGGPFGPGATPDPARDIGIRLRSQVEFPGNIGVGGSRGADSLRLSSVGSTRPRINLDVGDGVPQVTFPPSVVGVLVRGGGGADRIDARAMLRRRRSLSVYAGRGPDRVWGAAGPDFIFGRAGADRIDGGKGRDEIDCGPGRDVVVEREGRDVHIGCENVPAVGRIMLPRP